ncbi:hypothetical protein PRIPAC_97950, partial [Pristionchus pacificus]|uniref:Uncharacterized protein n=1 Tax=Pristionchus pacificus TaxID=54126 RepID=A0A8R1YIH0_PRIPA
RCSFQFVIYTDSPLLWEKLCFTQRIETANLHRRQNHFLLLFVNSVHLQETAEAESPKSYQGANETRVELQATLRKWKLTPVADLETCQMLNVSVIGCHSCREGASFDYTCQSTAQRAVGHVTCEGSDFTLNIECDPESTPRSARLVVDRAHIDEECNLRCGYREEKFHLKADLSMVAILGKDKLENARQSFPVIV